MNIQLARSLVHSTRNVSTAEVWNMSLLDALTRYVL